MAASSRDRRRVPARYSVLRHIADGGMASVWEANDDLLDRRVAVKVLSEAVSSEADARRRFTREARSAARLSAHPHVVTVYDAGDLDGQAYLVMALYSGGTVGDRIKAGPVPRAQALAWLEDTASALDLAHAEGVVRRRASCWGRSPTSRPSSGWARRRSRPATGSRSGSWRGSC